MKLNLSWEYAREAETTQNNILHQAIHWAHKKINLEFQLIRKCLYAKCFALQLRQRSTWLGNVARQCIEMGGTPTVQKMIIQLPKCGKIIHVTKYNTQQHQTIYCAAKTQDQFWGFQTTSQFQLQPPWRMSKDSWENLNFDKLRLSTSLVWCNYPPSPFWSLPLNIHLLHII